MLNKLPLRRRIGASRLVSGLALGGLLWSAASPLYADDSCSNFKWEVSHEHALFLGSAKKIDASAGSIEQPSIQLDKLYEIALVPQRSVTFSTAPAQAQDDAGAYGGMVRLHVEQAGHYRVSLNAQVWVDIVAAGKALPSIEHAGSHTCDAPHKIVLFDLPPGKDLILQFANAPQPRVRAAVTREVAKP